MKTEFELSELEISVIANPLLLHGRFSFAPAEKIVDWVKRFQMLHESDQLVFGFIKRFQEFLQNEWSASGQRRPATASGLPHIWTEFDTSRTIESTGRGWQQGRNWSGSRQDQSVGVRTRMHRCIGTRLLVLIHTVIGCIWWETQEEWMKSLWNRLAWSEFRRCSGLCRIKWMLPLMMIISVPITHILTWRISTSRNHRCTRWNGFVRPRSIGWWYVAKIMELLQVLKSAEIIYRWMSVLLHYWRPNWSNYLLIVFLMRMCRDEIRVFTSET